MRSSIGLPRDFWLRRIEQLDPAVDNARIYGIIARHEFPWDLNQSLSFALFRTYAVPSIGVLLQQTGEFSERTQQRYDDTALLLDAMGEHGLDSAEGRAALRRMNQMHAMYDISNDDLRYVLSTFVVVPIRWLDEYGWRPLTEREKVASAYYYRDLGRHMGIKAMPETWQEFGSLMDAYEAEHFAYDPRAREVADATLRLMATFPPHDKAPARAVIRFSRAYMDDLLLDAFQYPRPTRAERRAARAALRARGALLRRQPPRLTPLHARDLPNVRSYPGGYDVRDLGTFTPAGPGRMAGCPPQPPE
jgi:ER-bound oxygenase mpaB/B'/Rubber oxygenase, catalytic domain